MEKSQFVDQLLDFFLKEQSGFSQNIHTQSFEKKRELLHMIITIRSPNQIPEYILSLQD
jgi:hypothetical protein